MACVNGRYFEFHAAELKYLQN